MDRREALKVLTSVPGLTSVQRADVQPNDVLVLEVSGMMPDEQRARIHALMKEIWPNHKCVVLCDGMRLKVVRDQG